NTAGSSDPYTSPQVLLSIPALVCRARSTGTLTASDLSRSFRKVYLTFLIAIPYIDSVTVCDLLKCFY
ncbi:MAG: hypothetical protein WCT05_11115, partial [Lentisphaeria bacterium]